MPTLWEILTQQKKEQKPVEFEYYNPLKAKINYAVALSNNEYNGLNFIIKAINVYERHFGKDVFRFVDYDILSRRIDKDDVNLKMRLFPNEDVAHDLGHDVILLTKYDEFAYDENFHKNVLTDPSGQIDINVEDKSTSFWRVNDVKDPYVCKVFSIVDRNADSKIEKDEVRKLETTYWDFWREVEEEYDGMTTKYIEFLFVEMDSNSGYFTIWRGQKTPPENVIIF